MVGYVEIGVGFGTALIAVLAARFAKTAANAATKSFQAFVAAEDAHLDVQFTDGGVTENFVNGKRTGEWYGLNITVSNIGRSTANLHWYEILGTDQHYPVEKTLRKDEQYVLPVGIDLDELGPFELHVGYSSPIRQGAKLIVEATVSKRQKPHARASGQVIRTRIEGEVGEGGSAKPKWWHRLVS